MWQAWLSLPVFLVRILASVFPTLFNLSYPTVQRYGSLGLSLVFVTIVGSLYVLTGTSPMQKMGYLLGDAPLVTALPFQAPVDPTKPWRELLTLQPNHRDILLNLGRTLNAAGQTDEALPYLERAQQLDPNFNSATAQ